MKVDPLISKKKRPNVEIVQPKVINQTIKQMDSIMIGDLKTDKLIIGHNDKIKSSDFSINDILMQTQRLIPDPLKAGANITIKDNMISAHMYDDSLIKGLLQKHTHEHKNIISTIEKHIYDEIPSQINITRDSIAKVEKSSEHNNIKFMKSMEQIADMIRINNINTCNTALIQSQQIDALQQGMVLQDTRIDKQITDVVNLVQQSNTSNIHEMQNSMTQHNMRFERRFDKTQEDYSRLDDKITESDNRNNDKLSAFKKETHTKLAEIYKHFDKNFQELQKEICHKVDNYIQMNNKKLKDYAIDLQDLKKDVHEVRKLDPNNKQLQKLINHLSSKVKLIDDHFSFSITDKHSMKNIQLAVVE